MGRGRRAGRAAGPTASALPRAPIAPVARGVAERSSSSSAAAAAGRGRGAPLKG